MVNSLTSKTNVLSTLYNGNILYNISPNGEISTDITRNYNKLTIKYKDIDSENEIEDETIYYFNDRAEYHLDRLNYIKDIKDYIFVNSTYIPNQVLTEDGTIYCYYKKRELSVNYSTEDATNQDVTVYIVSNVQLNELDGWILSQDISKTYTQNANENVVIKDLAGNEVTINVNVSNIEKTELFLKGDVNKNGEIDISDILQLESYIAFTNSENTAEKNPEWKLNDEKLKIGYINENGVIDIVDILKLLRYMAASNNKETAQKHTDWINL